MVDVLRVLQSRRRSEFDWVLNVPSLSPRWQVTRAYRSKFQRTRHDPRRLAECLNVVSDFRVELGRLPPSFDSSWSRDRTLTADSASRVLKKLIWDWLWLRRDWKLILT